MDIFSLVTPEGVGPLAAATVIFVSFFTAGLTAAFGLGGGIALLAAMSALLPAAALAENLTIGTATETTSVDPHAFTANFNMQVAEHIFESLVWKDERQQLKPGLATSWRTVDDKTWEQLRGLGYVDGESPRQQQKKKGQ